MNNLTRKQVEDLVMESLTPPAEFHLCTDARVWAYYFAAVKARHPGIADDTDTMTTWFANAIMAGHDSQAETIRRLRVALIQCGRLVGGAMSDDVSNAFLAAVPDEVRGFVSKHSTCWPGSSHPVVTELIDALRDSTDHIDHVTAPTRDEDIAVIDRARLAIARATTGEQS